MRGLEDQLRARFGARVKANQMLAEFTSFRIGGPADLLIEVENEDELTDALAAANRCGAQAFCLGAGTNLLVSDRGMRGLVVHLGEGNRQIVIDGTRIFAGAAAQFGDLVARAEDRLLGQRDGRELPQVLR